IVRRSARILRQSFGTVRSAAFRRSALSLLKTCSMQSDNQGDGLPMVVGNGPDHIVRRMRGRSNAVAPTASIASVTPATLGAGRLMTTSRWSSVWRSGEYGGQSFAPRATAPKSHQAGAGGGLVDEHQSGGIKQTLLANPAPPCPRHVRPF